MLDKYVNILKCKNLWINYRQRDYRSLYLLFEDITSFKKSVFISYL